MKPKITLACWVLNLVSAFLIAWQGMAIVSGRAPEHIRPLVEFCFSGSGEAVPLSYGWMMKIWIFSVITFSMSYTVLIAFGLFDCIHTWKQEKSDPDH